MRTETERAELARKRLEKAGIALDLFCQNVILAHHNAPPGEVLSGQAFIVDALARAQARADIFNVQLIPYRIEGETLICVPRPY